MKKILKKLHLYFALLLCLPLILQGLTGSIMVFRNQISDAILKCKHDFADGEIASKEAIIEVAKQNVSKDLSFIPSRYGNATQVAPRLAGIPIPYVNGTYGKDFEILPIKIPTEKNSAVKVRFAKIGEKKPSLEVVIDPVSLQILEVNNPAKNFFRLVKKFHEDLFIEGRIGKNIVGIYGIAMFFMCISGLVIWWPKAGMLKRALTFKFSDSGKKFLRDFHGAIGFWMTIPLAISSFTGIYLIYFRTKESNKIWQALHEGAIGGMPWQVTVFLVGFLPLFFSITGIALWWLKKKSRANTLK